MDTKFSPIGWITDESELRISAGGNESRGTVPMHADYSKAACIPVYPEHTVRYLENKVRLLEIRLKLRKP